jgi:hypothetical protein
MRPPAEDGDAYRLWLDAVATPMSVVEPQSAPVAGRPRILAHAPAATANWSGLIVGVDPQSFDAVLANWRVPQVAGDPALPSSPVGSAFWVGLGGFNGHYPLVQIGTEQDATGSTGASSPYAWWVTMDNAAASSAQNMLTTVPVSAGDLVRAEVWIGPASGPDLAQLEATFRFWNLTQLYTMAPLTQPLGAPSDGSEVEWIMERPLGQNGSLVPLANYHKAAMTDARARRAGSWTLIPCTGGAAYTSYPLEITDSQGAVLSRVSHAAGASMDVLWGGFQ